MKTKLWAVLVSLFATTTIFSAGLAEANGTLVGTFLYKDPTTGVVQNLVSGFFYLHNATKPAPMEKFFTQADFILGPGNYNTGRTSVSVPEGTYYIRFTQRKVIQGAYRPYGPPEPGDLTWMQTLPITISTNKTLDLGTQLYAYPFATAPIKITGIVTSAGGVPLAGRYVRAQTEPCHDDGYNYDINQCGPVKNLALQPTDTNGNYTLILRNPGTYYIYTSPCISASYKQYTGNVCQYRGAPGPVTVKLGDTLTVNLLAY